jgi:hypothetical protein
VGAKNIGSKRAFKSLVALFAAPLLLATTFAVSPVAASGRTELRLPNTQGATQRFIVAVATDADVAEIGRDLEVAGAAVHGHLVVFSAVGVGEEPHGQEHMLEEKKNS